MATQIFSNNARTTLASSLALAATSATLTDGSVFTIPAGEYELLTIVPANKVNTAVTVDEIEIVKMTAISGNDITTMVRAQEGTTAKDWDAGAYVVGRITAGTLNRFVQLDDGSLTLDNGGDAKGSSAVNLQSGRTDSANVASGSQAVALGYNTRASGSGSSAIGTRSHATAQYATAFGYNLKSRVTRTFMAHARIASGNSIWLMGSADAFQYAAGGITELVSDPIGFAPPQAWQPGTAYSNGDVVIPQTPSSAYDGLQFVMFDSTFTGVTSGGSEPSWPTTPGDSVGDGTGDWVCIDTTNYVISVPTGARFYLEECGIICESITLDSPVDLVQPSVSFGINGQLEYFKASAQTTALTQSNTKQRYVLSDLSNATLGVQTLAAALTVDGTAYEMKGRFYWRGTLVADIG